MVPRFSENSSAIHYFGEFALPFGAYAMLDKQKNKRAYAMMENSSSQTAKVLHWCLAKGCSASPKLHSDGLVNAIRRHAKLPSVLESLAENVTVLHVETLVMFRKKEPFREFHVVGNFIRDAVSHLFVKGPPRGRYLYQRRDCAQRSTTGLTMLTSKWNLREIREMPKSFEEQVRLFSDAKLLVMVGGGSDMNLFFLPRGTKLYHVMPCVRFRHGVSWFRHYWGRDGWRRDQHLPVQDLYVKKYSAGCNITGGQEAVGTGRWTFEVPERMLEAMQVDFLAGDIKLMSLAEAQLLTKRLNRVVVADPASENLRKLNERSRGRRRKP